MSGKFPKAKHILLYAFTLLFIFSNSCFSQEYSIEIFQKNDIHFSLDEPSKYATTEVLSADNGREIYSEKQLPTIGDQMRITAHVELNPIPKDEITVHDKWDRAGNIRLSKDGMADIEIVKFITSYGGHTVYNVDVSHLAALLQDKCVFKGFVDTWVSPAWKVDFSLKFEPIEDSTGEDIYIDYVYNPDWVEGIMFTEAYTSKEHGEKGVEIDVTVPDDMKCVVMNYFVSGHCTDGSGADEFIPKDNVIYVDDRIVYRFQPWRDDCRQFREINPYTRRWSDGYWSSDYSRSGWCPGDKVDPVQIDLSDYLKPGQHKIKFVIENVRPDDEKNNHGYWRISSHLLGWKKKANLIKW
ncbi:MAG: peptide-N-glycosidase F-related protein [candidate division Zixibacteria bacterium]